MDLKTLLKEPEGRTLEFKRDLSSLRPVLRTLVAFANTAGGTIVVGVEDDGRLSGLADSKLAEERIANAIADNIRPALFPDIEQTVYRRKRLLLIRVARWPGPYHMKAEGPERGVYLRLGSTNRRASTEAVEELRRESRSRAFDQLPCVGAERTDLDADLIRRLFETRGRSIDDAKLESLGVLVRHGRYRLPSNGGVILFGGEEARRQFFPDARIRCARFKGTGKARFLDQLEIETSMIEAFEEALRFIERNTRLGARIEGPRREDIPEYPPVALREGLINAIAHADYTLTGMNLMVAIFDDRLEVQNPGTFPFGLTVEDFKAGVSRIRNPVIARVLRELELMETWGSGFRRIREDCAEGGYPLPEWQELGAVIRSVFAPHPEVAARGTGPDDGRDLVDDLVDDLVGDPEEIPENVPASVLGRLSLDTNARRRQLWFLSRLIAGARLRAPSIKEQFGVGERTARRDVELLKKAGVIEFTGAPRTGWYQFIEP